MKKLILVTGLLLLSAVTQAADFYIEGQLGYGSVNDIALQGNTDETGEFDVNFGYDNSVAYGFEVGIQNFESHNVLRLSLAWSLLDFEVENAYGDFEGGTELDPDFYYFEGSDLAEYIDFTGLSDGANIFSVNLYYDFPTQWKFKPYLGIGVGFAELESYESGLLLSLGGRYDINDNWSWGVKYQHSKFSIGDDSEFNWRYGSLKQNVLSGTISYKF